MMKRTMTAMIALAASLTLAACGSATVDSDNEVSPDATVAPLERGNSSDSTESETQESKESKESKEKETTSSTSRSRGESEGASASNAPQAKDRGAQEVEQAPTPQPADADAAFLDELAGAGVDVAGAESQLIGAGHTACNPDDMVTVAAVAGQLIEQGRTDLSAEEAAQLLDEKAQAAYC